MLKVTRVLIVLMVLIGSVQAASTGKPSGPILVLYAFDEEGVALGQQMAVAKTDTVLGRKVLSGSLAGQKIVLAETGVGMTNAAMTTQALIDRYYPRMILLSGIAGAIDTVVKIGDICVPERWVEHDYGNVGDKGFEWKGVSTTSPSADSLVKFTNFPVDTLLLGMVEDLNQDSLGLVKIGTRQPRVIIGGVGVSGNQFIDSKEKREWLNGLFHAFVTDMESAAVAQVCTVNGLPYLIFRSASDLAGGSGSATARGEMDAFFRVAAKNSAVVVVGFLERIR